MESERPIEKLLRAFAKKRREQTRAPFELSAAARRRLLREVQRQHEEPSDQRGFFSTVIGLPRLAFVLSVVAVIAILAAMLLPALSKAKSKAQRTTALAQRKQAELEREMAREEVAAPAPAAAPAMSEMPARNAVADGFSDSGVTNAIWGAVTANGSVAKTSSLADQHQVHLSFDTAGETDQRLSVNPPSNLVTYGLSTVPSSPPAPAFAGAAAPATGGRFRRLNDASLGVTQAMSPVLAAFEVKVAGTNVRVVDADGSLYEGSLRLPETQLAKFADQKTLTITKDEPSRGGGEFYFRVEGTNRSLNQPIVFTGTLVSATNSAVISAPVGGSTAIGPLSATEPWSGRFDISGILTIDGKQTEIQAAPVAP